MSGFPKAFPGTEHYRELASLDRTLTKRQAFGFERQVNELCDHIEEQEKEVEILREALKFYADETNWTPWWWKGLERIPEAVEDDGDKAREALKGEK